ncbi:hypothetical protein [Bartonella sp. CB60]|uniref:hypothetical protein n=1 Tax=Bartonella sp. CB60 TaxID=3113619 RepID=UPI00300E0DCF
MKNPSDLMKFVQLCLSDMGATVWRNNTASGWTGKSIPLAPKQVYRAKGNERIVFNANWLRAGLCEGSSDLIGFKTITVTPDMVGKKLPSFTRGKLNQALEDLQKSSLILLTTSMKMEGLLQQSDPLKKLVIRFMEGNDAQYKEWLHCSYGTCRSFYRCI